MDRTSRSIRTRRRMAAPRIGGSSSSFSRNGSVVRVSDAPASAGAFLFVLCSAQAGLPRESRRRSEARENFAKVFGQGRLRTLGLPGVGMREAQAARVKHLARRF